MRVNAFCTDKFAAAKTHCDKLFSSCSAARSDRSVEYFAPFDGNNTSGSIYLDGMLDFDLLDGMCDYLFTTGSRAIVRAAYSLEETGIIEAKCKLSPIMLLHKLGVLGVCTIASGVCLDNDDLDLMAQEGVPLILFPTADAGYGNGFAPVCAAVKRGVRVGVGTFDGKYNPTADLSVETEFLRLTANAEMRTENALSTDDVARILRFERYA